jgi:hypothetical protein
MDSVYLYPDLILTKHSLMHLSTLRPIRLVYFVILVFSVGGSSMAQTSKVLEIREEGGGILSFSHIENLTQARFTLADETGRAVLIYDSLSIHDTYKITHVGHTSYYINGLGTSDTIVVYLIREATLLREVPVKPRSFDYSKRYRIRCNANTSMIYTVGQMFSKEIGLEQKEVELYRLHLSGKGDWDSMVVRISLLDTLSFARHMVEGQLYTVHGNKLSFENLTLYAADEEGNYYLNFEVVAFYGSSTNELDIQGCSPDHSEGIMMKGKHSYPTGFLSSSWHFHAYWEPKLEIGYRY